MSELRSNLLRIADDLPNGDPTRRKLLAALREKQGKLGLKDPVMAGAHIKKFKAASRGGYEIEGTYYCGVEIGHTEYLDKHLPFAGLFFYDDRRGWECISDRSFKMGIVCNMMNGHTPDEYLEQYG